jgi:hypothetical protein
MGYAMLFPVAPTARREESESFLVKQLPYQRPVAASGHSSIALARRCARRRERDIDIGDIDRWIVEVHGRQGKSAQALPAHLHGPCHRRIEADTKGDT